MCSRWDKGGRASHHVVRTRSEAEEEDEDEDEDEDEMVIMSTFEG